MTYLLIFFVIAVALAPLSHFIPSKRQREIARMREYAALHGMYVEFRDLPARPGALAAPRDRAGHDTIYYGKRLPPARQKTDRARAWVHGPEGWSGIERGFDIPPALALLPPDVLAASVDASSCGVYWRESAGVEGVEKIRQALEAWSDQLRG